MKTREGGKMSANAERKHTPWLKAFITVAAIFALASTAFILILGDTGTAPYANCTVFFYDAATNEELQEPETLPGTEGSTAYKYVDDIEGYTFDHYVVNDGAPQNTESPIQVELKTHETLRLYYTKSATR